MAYCTYTDVRNITNLIEGEISNTEINTVIEYATYQLNADIGVTIKKELASAVIGSIDGSNKIYTLKNSPIGDMDNDGSVGTTDIEIWYKLNADDHFSKMSTACSSVDDHEEGKITLATAPATTYDYIIKYVWFPIPYNHKLIKQACVELSSYMCFLKLNLKDVDSYRIGKVSVSKTARHPSLVNFYDRYKETIGRIRGSMLMRITSWEMNQNMADELVDNIS